MAADGSHGPRPWVQRQARTIFLRVPSVEWVAVSRGRKREFRAGSGQVSGLKFVEPPVPVVAYAVRGGRHRSRLLVLEERWQEPLGAISEESLRREGFESLAEFRRHWMRRERRRFLPLRTVTVYRVRPWGDDDAETFGSELLRRLYGEWL